MRSVSKKRQRQRRSPEGGAYRNMLGEVPWCFACGRTAETMPRNWAGVWMLQRAHLAAGSGRMVRVEDRRGVNVLCVLCHMLHSHHGTGTVRINCREYRTISDANMLWMKRERDPDFWDWDWIASKWIGIPPEPVEPVWLRAEFKRRAAHG